MKVIAGGRGSNTGCRVDPDRLEVSCCCTGYQSERLWRTVRKGQVMSIAEGRLGRTRQTISIGADHARVQHRPRGAECTN